MDVSGKTNREIFCLFALAVFLLAGLTDLLDGFIARRFGQKTPIGTFLDPAADKLLLTASFIVLSQSAVGLTITIPLWLTITVIGRDVLLVISIVIINLTMGRHLFPPSIYGKATTAVQLLTVLMVLVVNYLELSLPWMIYGFYVAFLLTIISGMHYLARGMKVDDFAPNLSFFLSAGMDPEYSVLGRVARRIWAVTMRDRYGAAERSQKLKYHTQTSGRSLHAQEFAFNDIRTTLQALVASYDNTNSLHTNAYDEAITTPSEESVRRAMAIQMIIGKEWGLAKNENPNQGSFIIEELTDLVEEAVLQEFERISDRGGVLGAMETGYQRGKIQDESLYYETLKHDGSYPIIGVNTFINPEPPAENSTLELARSSEREKKSQLKRLAAFQKRHDKTAPAMLERLKDAARSDGNVFAVLVDAVRVCSLGQITNALFEVGGQYRRNM